MALTGWGYVWNRLKAVPAGVWAALGAGFALLVMYLRGRRLEAELAAEKLKSHAANAAARSARSEGRAQVHIETATKHEARAQELQRAVKDVSNLEKQERDRIETLPSNKVTSEYLKLTREKRNSSDG